MAASSPTPRRITTPGWLDLRLVLGVVLVLAAVLIGATVVSGASHTYPMVSATRELAAGTVLSADDVTIARVQLPDQGEGVYLSEVADAVGKQLDRPVSRGELVPAAAVTALRARTTVTVPLQAGSAPDLRAGERIEVWVSTANCASLVLLPDVTVQSVGPDSGGAFTPSGGQDVVLSVDPALANRIVAALALDQAQIRAGILIGPRPVSRASALPDVSSCAGPTAGR